MSIQAAFDVTRDGDLTTIRHDWNNEDDVEMGTRFHCETRHIAWVKEQVGLFLHESQWGGAQLAEGGDALEARLGGDFDRGDPWLLIENRRPRELLRGGFSTLRLDVSMARQLAAEL
jgi:hypothetical protein